jgi:hypothetical protein
VCNERLERPGHPRNLEKTANQPQVGGGNLYKLGSKEEQKLKAHCGRAKRM